MKRLITVLLTLFICGLAEFSVANTIATSTHPTPPTEIEFFGKGKNKRTKAGKRKKNGRYKKKGGLFGRKKSGCGCPNN